VAPFSCLRNSSHRQPRTMCNTFVRGRGPCATPSCGAAGHPQHLCAWPRAIRNTRSEVRKRRPMGARCLLRVAHTPRSSAPPITVGTSSRACCAWPASSQRPVPTRDEERPDERLRWAPECRESAPAGASSRRNAARATGSAGADGWRGEGARGLPTDDPRRVPVRRRLRTRSARRMPAAASAEKPAVSPAACSRGAPSAR